MKNGRVGNRFLISLLRVTHLGSVRFSHFYVSYSTLRRVREKRIVPVHLPNNAVEIGEKTREVRARFLDQPRRGEREGGLTHSDYSIALFPIIPY